MKYYDICKALRENQYLTFKFTNLRYKDFYLKGGETMEERNDMKRSSALKKFIYSQLDRLKGQAETPNADLKIIEAKKNILEEIIKICENRGRY